MSSILCRYAQMIRPFHERFGQTGPRYDAINIKLDKAGTDRSLNHGEGGQLEGLSILVGCMVATSLAMAPAMLIAQDAEWVTWMVRCCSHRIGNRDCFMKMDRWIHRRQPFGDNSKLSLIGRAELFI